jgi:hypothetical protein
VQDVFERYILQFILNYSTSCIATSVSHGSTLLRVSRTGDAIRA